MGNLDDVGKTTLKETTSKESLQTIAISAAAAGLATGATNALVGTTASSTAASGTASATSTTTSTATNKTTTAAATSSSAATTSTAASATASATASTISDTQRILTSLGTATTKVAINTTAYTIANSAITGNSLTESLKSQDEKLLLAQILGEVGAKEIGRAAHGSILTDSNGNPLRDTNGKILTTNPTITQPQQLAIHATLGAAISTSLGGDALSGAISGAISELSATESLKNGTTPQNAILLGQATGAASALITSEIQGREDEQTAKNIQLGGMIGVNAATNNATYVAKETGRVVGSDQNNDQKVVLLDENGVEKLYDENLPILKRLFSDTDSNFITNDNFDFRILKVDASYLSVSGGEIYDLTNKSDFTKLAQLTGKAGMSYSSNLTDMMFDQNSSTLNSNIGDQDMLNIFFQNGMQNDAKGANKSGDLIEGKTNREVGLIINSTDQGKLKVGGDIIEFLPNKLYLKDVLNGEVLQQIAANGNNKNLLIMHSAGNEDVRKAAEVLAISNVNLGGKIDFMSVGSPVPQKQLQQVLEPIGGNLIGQYNNWKDPVTHHKTWAAGTIGLLGYGVYYGATTGISMMGQPAVTTGTGLEGLASVVLGGGLGGIAGGGTTLYNLQIQHPFEAYFNKDFKNLQTDIKNWSQENPPK